ncbi:isochorismate synthase [Streptomyces sp. ST2-7A]|uniref:isochorismate synthase n=1 Tax=Streptomyces sp. ST2-7A TaxID=2907214 RepID=UPI001F00FCD9|nr:isochorismate synthase [Streptomyces sp. ST2-7A]MCE7082449.1 isochorismate synthase [Streptomyces sp. ST2-7A]
MTTPDVVVRGPVPAAPRDPAAPTGRSAGDTPGTRADRADTVGRATALLRAWRPDGDRFLASPRRTLLGRGVRAVVPHDERPVAERVAATLATLGTDSGGFGGHRDAGGGGEGDDRASAGGADHDPGHTPPGNTPVLVMGAVPFDADRPAALAVPAELRTAPPPEGDPLIALPADRPVLRGEWRLRPVPEPARYTAAVTEAVRRMRAGDFHKVVLARTLELDADQPPDLPAVLERLARRDPTGHTFALPTGPGRTLLGASPELLLSRTGDRVVANPLAGSVPRGPDLAEDVRRAARLLDSPKDLHEHAVVVADIRAALEPWCEHLEIPGRPGLVRTAGMWHLSTTVTGTLRAPFPTSLELAGALHPTPAICGTPTPVARRVIGELEPFDRGWFTGMVGWQDVRGDGEWVVTIRCAEAEGNGVRLYAGAGIVADSDPEAETAETGAKFRTLLRALEADL